MDDRSIRDRSKPGQLVPTSATYEIFVLVLAIASLLSLALQLLMPMPARMQSSLVLMGNGISFVFLGDFLWSLYRAPHRWAYLKWGWLDLLGGIPGFPLLRVARIGRIMRALNYLKSMESGQVAREFTTRRARSTLIVTALVVTLVLLVVSMMILEAESRIPGANITTLEDALWWAFVTVTTVGYGDRYPVTAWGRLLSGVLMTIGVGAFGILTSYIAHHFLTRKLDLGGEIASIKEELADIKRLLEEREQRLDERDGEGQV